MTSHPDIIRSVDAYYTNKIRTHGPTAKGMDWRDEETQFLRFAQLLKIVDSLDSFSINDLGCGAAATHRYMTSHIKQPFIYRGYDISEDMVAAASMAIGKKTNASVTKIQTADDMQVSDYSVASGIFNVKMDYSDKDWWEFCLKNLDAMNAKSTHGFAFNMLTAYSDKEYMRDDLFYPKPEDVFAHCKNNYSRHVTLLHDYPLYEFTVLVRKDVG